MVRTKVGFDGEPTVYIQDPGQVAEALENGCDECGEPLSNHYEEDTLGCLEILGLFDDYNLIGFLCPSCGGDIDE